MIRRAALVVGVVFVSHLATASADVWRVSVRGPHGFPDVDVAAGQDGHYVPTENTPIAMHARAGAQPFDGYIGYRFMEGRRIVDTPIIARAQMAAGSEWSFHTYEQTEHPGAAADRELVIEWRDRSMNMISSRRAGILPWTVPRPLRIVGAREAISPRTIYGSDAVLIRAADLGDEAHWFAGFRVIAAPVDVWLDLPSRTRETILHSGRHLVFFGTPRKDQQFTKLDDVVIPVRFECSGGEVAIPRVLREANLTSEWSWRAAPDATIIGNVIRPYIVPTPHDTYAADEAAIVEHPPWHEGWRVLGVGEPPNGRIPAELISIGKSRALIPLVAAAVIAPLCWLGVRKRTRLWLMIAALVTAALLLGMRDRIHARSATTLVERWMPIRPGIVRHLWIATSSSPTPLPAMPLNASESREWIALRGREMQVAEVRSANTPPGHGMLLSSYPIDEATRRRARVELGAAANVRVVSTSSDAIDVDYRIPFDATLVIAKWTSGKRHHMGETRARSSRGRVVVRDATMSSASWRWPLADYWRSMTLYENAEAVELTFVDDHDPAHVRVIGWDGAGVRAPFMPYAIDSEMKVRDVTQPATWTFRLPRIALPPHASVGVTTPFAFGQPTVDLIGERGTLRLTSSKRATIGTRLYVAPVDEVAKIAQPGEVVRVRASGFSPHAQGGNLYSQLKVMEN